MLDTLITSKTRIKLLLKFFLNKDYSSYLRNLESEFDESSNAVRVELNRFEQAGLLNSFTKGNKKYYKANDNHPLFKDIHNIILKYVGIDRIIENVVKKLGEIQKVYLTGDFARGCDNGIIDLAFIGKDINRTYLVKLIEKAENLINYKIRYLVYSPSELKQKLKNNSNGEVLLLWEAL
ncbi:MAG: ArsR family transcriptional regulator [Bacteroidales bacterium]|nr:ArsR family transcriptional regulator [Bacteroidales bacterium]